MAIVPYCYKYSHPIGNLINLFEYSISHRNVTNSIVLYKVATLRFIQEESYVHVLLLQYIL